jgi:hypothetical protein
LRGIYKRPAATAFVAERRIRPPAAALRADCSQTPAGTKKTALERAVCGAALWKQSAAISAGRRYYYYFL